jgi:adenylate cyclase
VVEDIIANPTKLALGGEVRELTLMFCDMRDFTSISEGLSASELTTFINELLTPLSDIILRERGTIDKYMGDAIMAFWNAPLDVSDHARRACRSAGSGSASIPVTVASAISAAGSASTIQRLVTRSTSLRGLKA